MDSPRIVAARIIVTPAAIKHLPFFDGFPYLISKIAPTLYHIILLPSDLPKDVLIEIGRQQAGKNDLDTCLVSAENDAIYFSNTRSEDHGIHAPHGGHIVFGDLKPAKTITPSEELAERFSKLVLYRKANESGRYIMGDPSKGGRMATESDIAAMRGPGIDGHPKGLEPCKRCGCWCGECLDPSPRFENMVMRVHCLCENRNLCAACGKQLADRKLNGNYYNERDGNIWHTPGFCGLAHTCS